MVSSLLAYLLLHRGHRLPQARVAPKSNDPSRIRRPSKLLRSNSRDVSERHIETKLRSSIHRPIDHRTSSSNVNGCRCRASRSPVFTSPHLPIHPHYHRSQAEVPRCPQVVSCGSAFVAQDGGT
ncbi:hypothetical protein BD309DRAFT_541436 [Dichomitus squalens]|nr:hypothetical protein BD309DRAFT_541436 [Dichomitus squalens]